MCHRKILIGSRIRRPKQLQICDQRTACYAVQGFSVTIILKSFVALITTSAPFHTKPKINVGGTMPPAAGILYISLLLIYKNMLRNWAPLQGNPYMLNQLQASPKLSTVMSTNDSGVDRTFPRQGFMEAIKEKESGRGQEWTGKEVAKKIAKESVRGLERGGKTLLKNAVKQRERGLERAGKTILKNSVKQRELRLERGGKTLLKNAVR